MLFRLLLTLLCLQAPLFSEDPWGKDAGMVFSRYALKFPPPEDAPRPSPVSHIAQKMIRFHQTTISPSDGPRSHHHPSSSQYTLEAVRKYGFFHGFILGCDRLMRENNEEWIYDDELMYPGPLGALKYDPVP